MPQVFASLAIAECLLLVGTLSTGIFAVEIGVGRHVALAVLTLILACLIQVAAFTYLTVTGKMIVQAVHLGDLSMEKIQQVKKLKRSWTFLLGAIVLLVVAVTASGSMLFHAGTYRITHIASAMALFAAHVWVYYLEYDVIYRNAQLVGQTFESYTERSKSAISESQDDQPASST